MSNCIHIPLVYQAMGLGMFIYRLSYQEEHRSPLILWKGCSQDSVSCGRAFSAGLASRYNLVLFEVYVFSIMPVASNSEALLVVKPEFQLEKLC